MQAAAEYNTNCTGILISRGSGVLGFEKLPANLRAKLQNSTRADFDNAFSADWPEIEFLKMDACLGLQQDSVGNIFFASKIPKFDDEVRVARIP